MNINNSRVRRPDIESATASANCFIERTSRVAKAFEQDPEAKHNGLALDCMKRLYADMKIGGAAMTESTCGLYRQKTMFGSTCIEVICSACAKEHDICKHFGADRELRPRRKQYHPKLAHQLQRKKAEISL